MVFTLAWRNVWRHGYRTVIAVLATALGLAFAIPSYGLMEGLSRQMLASMISMHLGAVQIHAKGYLDDHNIQLTIPLRLTGSVLQVRGVTGVAPRVYTGGIASSEHSAKVTLEPLSNGSPLPRCGAVVTRRLSEFLGLKKGSHFTFEPLPGPGACSEAVVTDVTDGTSMSVFMSREQVTAVLSSATRRDTAATDDAALDWEDDSDIDLPKMGDATSLQQNDSGTPTGSNEKSTGNVTVKVVRRSSSAVIVTGIDPLAERNVTLMYRHVTEGRYLQGGGSEPEIILGKYLARRLGVKPGDRIGVDMATVDGYLTDSYFRVVGIFSSGSPSMDRSMAFADLKVIAGLMGMEDRVHEIAVAIDDPEDSAPMSEEIVARVSNRYDTRPWQTIEPSLKSIMDIQNVMLGILLGIIFAIAALGVMNVVLVSVMERTREFGVLRALGTGPGLLVVMVVLETAMTLGMASVLGGFGGWIVNHYLEIQGLDLSGVMPHGFTFSRAYIEPCWRSVGGWKTVLHPTLLLFVVGLFFSLLPARRAARVRPVEVLRD